MLARGWKVERGYNPGELEQLGTVKVSNACGAQLVARAFAIRACIETLQVKLHWQRGHHSKHQVRVAELEGQL